VRYFEDLQPGDVALGSTFVVERDELVEFARRWDPQPFLCPATHIGVYLDSAFRSLR